MPTTCFVNLFYVGDVIIDEKKGRSLISKLKFQPGQSVAENEPFAWALRSIYWGSKCATCFDCPSESEASQKTLSRCSACKKVMYCSRRCQIRNWQQHKSECPQINSILLKYGTSALTDEIVLVFRVLTILKLPNIDCSMGDRDRTRLLVAACGNQHFYEMNDYGFSGDVDPNAANDEIIVSAIANAGVYSVEKDFIFKILRIFRGNNFGITDTLMNCVAVGVFPFAAILNHSCAPNCVLQYAMSSNGPRLKVRNTNTVYISYCLDFR